jgi:hypothetical protein
MVCGHLPVLRRLHHFTSPRKCHHCEGITTSPPALLYARMVDRYDLHGRYEVLLVIHAVSIFSRRYRRAVSTRSLAHDIFVVHQRGVTFEVSSW